MTLLPFSNSVTISYYRCNLKYHLERVLQLNGPRARDRPRHIWPVCPHVVGDGVDLDGAAGAQFKWNKMESPYNKGQKKFKQLCSPNGHTILVTIYKVLYILQGTYGIVLTRTALADGKNRISLKNV